MQYAHEPLVPPAKQVPQVDFGIGVLIPNTSLKLAFARCSASLSANLAWSVHRGPVYRPKRRALVRPRRPLRGETSIAARPTRSGLAFYAPVPTPPSGLRSSLAPSSPFGGQRSLRWQQR